MITTEHKISELRREIETRRRVYPGWVQNGRLSKQDADYRISVLEAILLDYVPQNMAEDPERFREHQDLFDLSRKKTEKPQ